MPEFRYCGEGRRSEIIARMPVPRYSTLRARFFASIVDGLVFLPLGFVDTLILDPRHPVWVSFIWSFVSTFAFYAYSIYMHARFGQTVGKMALQIKVLDVSEEKLPSYRQAIPRDAFYMVTSLVIFILAWTKQFRGDVPHDASLAAGVFWVFIVWLAVELVTTLTNIKIPVLVVSGDEDPVTVPKPAGTSKREFQGRDL